VEDRQFGRRYRVTERIGSGGMADVYKAQDEVLGRTVALKVLHPHYAKEEGFVARFRQEAQAAANLSHPNVVNIYDWGRDGEDYYIAMEHVRGTDLKSLVSEKGPVDPLKAAGYGEQVCSALAVAHGYGIVHRDIKPQNIIVTPDGTVKVTDFGIARAGDSSLTQTGSVLGTAQYISPEQAQGRPLGPAADLYSLGVVLYEIVTGKVPFDGDTPITVALKQVNETPKTPTELSDKIPPSLEAVIMRAMQKDPAERYSSAEEMKADLAKVRAGHTVPAAPPPMGETSVMPAVGAQATPPVGAPVPAPPHAAAPAEGSNRWWGWLLLVLGLIAVGFGAAWIIGSFSDDTVTVPSVIGLSSEDASSTILSAGLTLGDVTEEYSATVAKGKIIGQDPEAGASVEPSAAVDLVVSGGVEQYEVPDLAEMTESDAIAAIRAAGLVLETIQREYSGDVEEGLVIRQDPAAGEMVGPDTGVTLVVSQGTQLVKVPAVTEKTQAEATADLEDVGLVAEVKEEFSDTVPKGQVFGQSPGAGVSIEIGSKVTITVSKGKDIVTVPDCEDKPEEEALTLLDEADLIADVTYVDSGAANDGMVLTQWPIPGADADRGSIVELTVGRLPDE
jgi:serine/threonine-protein kinase